MLTAIFELLDALVSAADLLLFLLDVTARVVLTIRNGFARLIQWFPWA